jgi:protein SCO1/2
MTMHPSRFLLRLVSLLAITACARTTPPRPDATNGAIAAAERFSIYDLGSVWRNQHDVAFPLAALRGRPQALAMVYTHCGATCPITVAEMKRIAAETPAGVGLVLVSLDPDRDTPGRLASYAAGMGLDSARWTLLTAPDESVRELAATIGVRYRRMSPTEVAHGSVITLLDVAGVVVHQQQGLDGTDETIRIARTLAR